MPKYSLVELKYLHLLRTFATCSGSLQKMFSQNINIGIFLLLNISGVGTSPLK